MKRKPSSSHRLAEYRFCSCGGHLEARGHYQFVKRAVLAWRLEHDGPGHVPATRRQAEAALACAAESLPPLK